MFPYNLNSTVLQQLPEALDLVQRGLYYGDSLFETIRQFDGRMPWLNRHWARLSAGMQALHYTIPAHWDAAFFEQEITGISSGNARIRLTVWRSPGGLYVPEDNTPQFLISAQPLNSAQLEWPATGLRAGLCTGVRLPVDEYSAFKTLNAPRYVAAAQEARRRGLDDVILLNAFDRVCEATGSNVFWWEGDTLCTVPLSEGCVAGVMRSLILERSGMAGFSVSEKPATFAALIEADEVFCTNAVRGILPLDTLESKQFSTEKTRAVWRLMVGEEL